MSKVLFAICFVCSLIHLSSTQMSHKEAAYILQINGISVFKLCGSGKSPFCTSLEGIRRDTIDGIVELRTKSKCRIEVTGGTETGYTPLAPHSHENGYRANVRQNACVDNYIRTSNQITCKRIESGSSVVVFCECVCGNIYELWDSHWDIAFYPKSGDNTEVWDR